MKTLSSHVVCLLIQLFILINCSVITPIVESNSPHVIPSSVATSSSIDRGSLRNTSRIESLGFTHRCAESHPNELHTIRFQMQFLVVDKLLEILSSFVMLCT